MAATLLGVGLGGFFDGILLHQILQWHHLLSAVGRLDLRGQVLWDGLFHLLMYALTLAGLWGLWRHRGAGPVLPGVLFGFGLWHLLDAVLSHWLLGIHRLRMDAANPLAWDLGWLVAFGAVPMILGLLWRGGPRGPATAAVLTALALGGGAWAGRPPEGAFAVVFPAGTGLAEIMAAVEAADAFLLSGDPRQGVVVVDGPSRWTFWRHGAIFVGGAGLPAGCLSWARA